MPNFSRNERPAFYAIPTTYRATVGAAAITAFPAPVNATALQALTGVQASATAAFTGQPAVNSTLTVNGVPVTFVAPGSGGFTLKGQALGGTILSSSGVPLPYQAVGQFGLQCEISAAGLYGTLLNLVGLIRAWPDENLAQVHVRIKNGNTLLFTAGLTGTAGNAFTLASIVGTNATLTGATTVASGTAGNIVFSGGLNPTVGYAVLVDPQPHPVEIQAINAICRTSQAAGTITLFRSDGSVITKVPQGALTIPAGNTFSASQELASLPFTGIAAATPLLVQPWTGLYAYGSTTQVIDLEAGPSGAY